jgi:amino acid transporter
MRTVRNVLRLVVMFAGTLAGMYIGLVWVNGFAGALFLPRHLPSPHVVVDPDPTPMNWYRRTETYWFYLWFFGTATLVMALAYWLTAPLARPAEENSNTLRTVPRALRVAGLSIVGAMLGTLALAYLMPYIWPLSMPTTGSQMLLRVDVSFSVSWLTSTCLCWRYLG